MYGGNVNVAIEVIFYFFVVRLIKDVIRAYAENIAYRAAGKHRARRPAVLRTRGYGNSPVALGNGVLARYVLTGTLEKYIGLFYCAVRFDGGFARSAAIYRTDYAARNSRRRRRGKVVRRDIRLICRV